LGTLVAAALEAGATAFVTNDRRLKQVQDLKVLVLEDYLA
jgi:predicted nucleic acid-binding protein